MKFYSLEAKYIAKDILFLKIILLISYNSSA